jgi:GDP-4-dehydro-6-deoxy-D-mannose reductase
VDGFREMSKRIFVTGSEGFVGKKLTKFLESRGFEVFGHSQKLENHTVLFADLNAFAPDIVIHLAGLSNLLYCEQHPDEAYHSNVAGTAILLEQMIKLPKKPNLIFASSAQVYNLQSPKVSEKPVDEAFELGPNNVYGRTKLQAEWIIQGTAQTFGLKAVAMRLFNHTHRDQDLGFFLPNMYAQIRDTMDGGIVKVGNLNVSRDFSLVTDLLIAIEAIINNFQKMGPFEYFNACSGQARNLRELLVSLALQVGKKVNFVEEAGRVRVGEPLVIVGSGEKLKQKIGFSLPKRTVDEYVQCFLS